MTEHPTDSPPDTPVPPTSDAAENQETTATSNTCESTAAEPPAPQDPLASALADAERWKDLAYRNAAELDNFRKRMARETQEARSYANAELLRSLFPILDNFEMGLEAARAESEKSVIFMGMSMVHRQIVDFLRESGVQELSPAGQAFDPNSHDAVSQEASDSVPEGVVLRVARKGYLLKDRLLRPATVIVSSGRATDAATSA
jgi:molecular chaperone GrpE